MSKFKVEAGKTYVADNGAVIGPMEWYDEENLHAPDAPSPYDGALWYEDGTPWSRPGRTLIREHTTNTLTVGETYTSENGNEWYCIAVHGDTAWLVYSDNGQPDGPAYMFNLDGTNISQGGGKWNIVFGPKRETVRAKFGTTIKGKHPQFDVIGMLEIDIIDGKPDWDTAKVTGA